MRRSLTSVLAAIVGINALAFVALSIVVPSPASAAPPLCGTLTTQNQGTVPQTLRELSGLVVSRAEANTHWVVNDSNGAKLHAVNPVTGAVRATYTITGVTNDIYFDWEDLAIVGGAGQYGVLYIADIGDNNDLDRPNLRIYRVNEPDVVTGVNGTLAAQTITLKYPDGPRDAQTFFVDPRTGEAFVVTAEPTGQSRVYKAKAPLTAGSTQTLKYVTTLSLGFLQFATGGSISVKGNLIAIRTYGAELSADDPDNPDLVFVWRRKQDERVVPALKRAPCRPTVQLNEAFGQTIGLLPDNSGFATVSELAGAKFKLHTLAP